jgi:hypothetical protein
VLERRAIDNLVVSLTGQTLLIMQRNEECYRQRCRTGSLQTLKATEGWLRGERDVCSGGRIGQREKNEDWRRRA